MFGFNRLSIAQKLFLAFLAVNAIALSSMFLLTRRALDRGFLNYVQQIDEERQERLVKLLAKEYSLNSGWRAIRRNPRMWRRLVHLAESNDPEAESLLNREGVHNLSGPPFPPKRHSEGENFLGEGNREGQGERRRRRRPPPRQGNELFGEPLMRRLSLYNGFKEAIFGDPTPSGDVALVPISVDGGTVGFLGVAPMRALSTPRDIGFLRGMTEELAWFTAILLGLSTLVAVVIVRQLVRRVKHLTDPAPIL